MTDSGDLDRTNNLQGPDGPISNVNPQRQSVDGYFDLVDFFPIALDIGQLVKCFPPPEYQYRLKREGGGLNVVPTTLTEERAAYSYLIAGSIETSLKDAATERTDIGGYRLADVLVLGCMQKPAVIIAEGALESNSPLVLEVSRGTRS